MSISTRLTRVGGKFVRGRLIGSGSFGEVYHATNVLTGEEVAMKVAPMKEKMQKEADMCKRLAGEEGMPKMHWYGVEGNRKVMVMSLLGPSLEDMFNACGRSFELKFVLPLADQLISRLESMHRRGVVHRDVKPDNFLIGDMEGAGPVHVVDFGLSKLYLDPANGRHIPSEVLQHDMGVGTASYSSLNSHLGIERSRRDDLEALGYMLVYFLRGSLPWQGLSAPSTWEGYEKIREVKLATSLHDLCEGLPTEFKTYLECCRAIEFEEAPDYNHLRSLFRNLLSDISSQPSE